LRLKYVGDYRGKIPLLGDREVVQGEIIDVKSPEIAEKLLSTKQFVTAPKAVAKKKEETTEIKPVTKEVKTSG